MRSLSTLLLGLLAIAAPMSVTLANDIKHGALVLSQPWTRATPPGSKVAAGYMRIKNTGSEADRLVSATSEIAGVVEIHEMKMIDGVMKMRALPNGITIAPGAEEELKPGGNHIMFMALKGQIAKGDTVSARLVFEKAGAVTVSFEAAKIGAQEPGHHAGHHGHDMKKK